jgi:rSAM/selenodomain-associated transferase 1
MTDGKLIIFLKNPELGKVKTRLAQRIGDEAALAISFKLIRQTQEQTDGLSQDKAVFYSSFIDREDNWDNKKYTKHLQKGDTMGDRMFHALSSVLSEGYSKAVLIGSDIHLLRQDIIEDAFQKLETHDVVLGPAKDGGYYLIGIKKAEPGLFDLKYWSTPNVFSETVKKIKEHRLSYAQTDLLNDIDEYEDLKGTDLY